jgi:hypothetical protein
LLVVVDLLCRFDKFGSMNAASFGRFVLGSWWLRKGSRDLVEVH